MPLNKKYWQGRINRALRYLKDKNTPVALSTVALIETGEVVLKPLQEMSDSILNILKRTLKRREEILRGASGVSSPQRQQSPIREPRSASDTEFESDIETPSGPSDREEIFENYIGTTVGNEIWVSDLRGHDISLLAWLLVHECTHYLNDDSCPKHGEPDESHFNREFRADIAAALAFGKQITHQYLDKLATITSEDYGLPRPSRIEKPAGVYYKDSFSRKRITTPS